MTQDERTPDPDIERLRELAAETQSAAARILAERDRYREAGIRVGMYLGLDRKTATQKFERNLEALNEEAGK